MEGHETELDDETMSLPLQHVSDSLKARIEQAFIDAYRLFRDRNLVLQAVDGLWVRHLTDLEGLREGIGLRAYGQQNPLVAYRKEAYDMYEVLLGEIQSRVARSAYLVPQAVFGGQRRRPAPRPRVQVPAPRQQPAREPAKPDRALGRNDPCWCGSGKKYKQCHMREDAESQRNPSAMPAIAGGSSGASKRHRRRRR